jgi:hypothetical protein
MDYSYKGRHPPPQLAAMVAQTNQNLDDEWYADSGANAHITNELKNLSIQQPFQSGDTVVARNGDNLTIEHIGFPLYTHLYLHILFILKMCSIALMLLQTYYSFKVFIMTIPATLYLLHIIFM